MHEYKPLIKSWAAMVEEMGDDPQEALSKAMSTAGLTGGDATPLRTEDLDRLMTSVLYKKPEFVLYNWIKKTATKQIDWQWNRRNSYGSARQAPGFVEGSGPSGRDSKFTRNTATVRYMGLAGGYTLQDSRVGQAGGQVMTPEVIEQEDTTIELLKIIEKWQMWGDSAIKDSGSVGSATVVNYDGLYNQIKSAVPANIIDKLGQPLTVDDLESAAEDFRTNAFVTDFSDICAFMSPKVLSSFSNTLQGPTRERIMVGEGRDIRLGHTVSGYQSNFGYIPFKDSIWLELGAGDAPLSSASSAQAPSNAGLTVTVTTQTSVAGSLFTQTGDNTTYYYWVGAVGDGGEAAAVAGNASAAVALNGSATLSIAKISGVTHYVIYRSTTNSIATGRRIGHVVQTSSAGPYSFVDLNTFRPNTGVVALLNNNEENLIIPQLMPLMKLMQPLQKTTQPFYLLLYHTLVVRAAERQKIFINVGRSGLV